MSEYRTAKTGDVLFWYNKHCCTFWCPGCKQEHPYYISQSHDGAQHPVWQYNNNPDKPTFEPSLLVLGKRCHLYVRDGMIQFLTDCEHEFAGQTVAMIPWDESDNYWKGGLTSRR